MWVSPGSSSSMEVDAVRVGYLVNGIAEQADEQSLSPEVLNVYDVFGDPEISPRVGEEYQAELPPLISESERLWFQKNLHEAESSFSTVHKFGVGLPIPVIWTEDEAGHSKHDHLKHARKSTGSTDKIESSNAECIQEIQNGMDCMEWNHKLELKDSTFDHSTKLGELGVFNVKHETQIGMHEKHKDKDTRLVPGSASGTWNEMEEASFLLGLYIFGKNLVQVKKFIGNKKMGDILAFYYGKFYKSDRYCRWSRCRKMRKSRKCIFGQKIFTGPRQQELLSRLQPGVSEECHNKLLEVSKTFVEGKMLLEDYIFTLKACVGLKALVEAVGVGKGKEDLTGLAVDSMKSTQALPFRPEIPVGKACSMLTLAEIISFLTGNFRLSKARTSDLFWEAVWPRLLARGWHSEQPGNYNYAVASKHPLVFLVPGVKKFSRKLVKGNHYFDSVSDVLGKVASDPELIELESVADNDCTSKDGNGWTKELRMDQEISPDQPRHCYLKVKTPTRSTDTMKFTVVDTSLASEKMRKVRELRSLPFGVLKASTSENDSDDEDTSEELTNESESVNAMCFETGKTGSGVSSELNGLESNPSKEELPMSSRGSTSLSAASKDQKTDFISKTNQKRDVIKCQSLQRMVSDKKMDFVPVTKRRRRLTACSRAKKNGNSSNIFVVPGVKQAEASFLPDGSKSGENVTANFFVAPKVNREKANYCPPYSTNFVENVISPGMPAVENNTSAGLPIHENKILADPPSNDSTTISREAVPAASSSGTKDQPEKPQPRTMIDLNLPVSPELEADEPFGNEVTETQQNNTSKESDELSVGTICKPLDHSDHQPDVLTRRQSTRNRPPTAKVLEAFAFGYLDRKEKRRGRDYLPEGSVSRPSRRVSRKVAGSASAGASFEKDGKANVFCIGSGSTDSNVICTDFKSSEG